MMKTVGLLSLQTVLPVNGSSMDEASALEFYEAYPAMQFQAPEVGEDMDHTMGEHPTDENVLYDEPPPIKEEGADFMSEEATEFTVEEGMDPEVAEFFQQDAKTVQDLLKTMLAAAKVAELSTETKAPVGTAPTVIPEEDMEGIKKAAPVLNKIFENTGEDMSPKETQAKLEKIIMLYQRAQKTVDTGRRWNLGRCDRGDKEHKLEIIPDVATKEECRTKSLERNAYATQWEQQQQGCYYTVSKKVFGVALEKIESKDEVYPTECIIGDPEDEEELEKNPVPNSRLIGFPADAEIKKKILEKAEKLAKEAGVGFPYKMDDEVTDQKLVEALPVLEQLKEAAEKVLDESASEDDAAVTDTEVDVSEETLENALGEIVETVDSKVTSVTSTEKGSGSVKHSSTAAVPGEHSEDDHDHTGEDDGHNHEHHDYVVDHKHSEDDHDHTGKDDGHDHDHHDESVPEAAELYDESGEFKKGSKNESSDASRTTVGASMLLAVLLSMLL